MSLAGPEDDILALLLQKSLDQGIVVVAADSDSADDDHFPASMPGVLAATAMPAAGAAASHSTGSDQAAMAAAPKARIAAPGVGVLGTAPGNTYDFFSGNSFAAATVSGLAALLLQQCGAAVLPSLAADLQAVSRQLLAGEPVHSLTCLSAGSH